MTCVKNILGLWCALSLALETSGQYTPLSPCPKIFSYENDGQQWYGKIKIPSPPYGSEMILRVKMSLGASLPTKYSGNIELMGERGIILNNILRGLPITYKVNFPLLHPLPKITEIIFNGRMLCRGPPETFASGAETVTAISLDHSLQTGDRGSAQRPSYDNVYGASPSYDFGEFPNPETFARPQNSKRPRPQQRPERPQSPQSKPVYNDYDTSVGQTNGDESIDKFVNQWVNNQQGNQNQPSQPPSWAKPQAQAPQPSWTDTQTQRPPPVRPEVQSSDPWDSEPETSQPPRRPQSQPSPGIDDSYECGIPNPNPLVIKGMETKKGDWPWLVAMYVKKPSSLDFTCAGTLISHKHVITAAHCVNGKSNRPITVHEVIIKVGVFNLQDWTDSDMKQLGVSNIISHPKYTGGLSHLDDISIFILVKRIEFTNFITPACLWNMNTDLNSIVGRNGTVVGWGRDENGLVATPEPRQGKVPIVSTQTCRASLPQFDRLTSDTTLCAGAKDGTGPCNGDSGGGMYLSVKNRWYIRAIVSLSLPGEDMPCNLNEYVVYTDTAKYLPWIRQVMSENQ